MTHKQRLLALFSTVPGLFACLPAMAQPTLYLGMNGGTMERLFSDSILPRFEQANGVKVVIVPGTSADILAKVQATPGKPSVHVMVLDDGIMYRAIGMGLCSTLKPNPTLAQLPEKALIKDKAAAVSLGVTGLAYNSRLFKEKGWAAPTSWNDLADPRFKDKVVFQSLASSTFGLHGFLMYNRLQGGSDTDVNPGFIAWQKHVGPNVLEYIPNSAKLSEMVQTDEAALFPLTPTQVTALKLKGIPVEYAAPKEGAVVLNQAECVTANNDQPELAQKLAEFLLSPEAQAPALELGDQIPSNPNTPTSDKTRGQVEAMHTYLQTAVTIDWDQVNNQRPEWNARWNRQIER
ncbi:ABC transporter substrate-binding protein [Pseudomonas sp. BCRC 81390]|uniref:ABC transporter substrate-binding protein n=1 Tax=Pseudomonas sp. BCRC 81390 TaxID=3054778 RepID=UPI00259297F6|nr:ABC transporter substrate-binding protein [Pseudomonas sp. BCRC 81390]MDM3886579.1 ABC transporter substrate-binding protein [Pseudomonas sp. BCRC 81390]